MSTDRTGSSHKRANHRGADLRGDVFHSCDCTFASFNGADCRGTSFRNSDMRWSDFRGANIEGADFTGANVDHVRWTDEEWHPDILALVKQNPAVLALAEPDGSPSG